MSMQSKLLVEWVADFRWQVQILSKSLDPLYNKAAIEERYYDVTFHVITVLVSENSFTYHW